MMHKPSLSSYQTSEGLTITNENTNIKNPTASPSSQNPLVDLETMMLGKSSFSSNGLRPLADVAPFRIVGGHVSVNLPNNDIKLVVHKLQIEVLNMQ